MGETITAFRTLKERKKERKKRVDVGKKKAKVQKKWQNVQSWEVKIEQV